MFKTFQCGFQKCIPSMQRTFLEETRNCLQKNVFPFLNIERENASDVCPIYLTALSWLHSRCPREHFELENVLCIVPGGWPIIFQSTGGKGFKKYIEKALCASRKTFWRNCFAKKFNNASAQREKFFCN